MNPSDLICSTCHLGKLQVRKSVYTRVLGDRLLVIPNVLALVCDVCGERTFDRDMLSQLSGLLSALEAQHSHSTNLV